jgi:polysaccharide export outer membrane protein
MVPTIPVLLLRISALVCAGLLLFAAFAHARADSYGNDNYGLAPLPPASQAAAASATAFGGAPAPATPDAALPGKTTGTDTAVASSPKPPPPASHAGTGDNGLQPDMHRAQMPAQGVSSQAIPARAAASATTPYGYKKGDGDEADSAPLPIAQADHQPPLKSTDNSARASSDYVLGTGDKIHLTVFDEPDLSGDFTVDSSGFVRLPLIGQVRAAGYAPSQLEAEVAGALAKGYLRAPRVSVEMVSYRPFYVVGAVGRPGEYPYVNHMNVLNAIAIAGGFLPSAVESVVYVRPQGGIQEYKVLTDGATLIHPGDVVRVETTFFWDAMSLFSPLNGVASIAVAGIR